MYQLYSQDIMSIFFTFSSNILKIKTSPFLKAQIGAELQVHVIKYPD